MTPPTQRGTTIQVMVDTPFHSGLSMPLDYLALGGEMLGSLVRVPLGKREVLGLVSGLDPADASGGQDIRSVLEHWPMLAPLSATWLQLIRFAAPYYQRGLGELAMSAMPAELRSIDGVQLARRLKRMNKLLAEPNQSSSQGSPELSAAQNEALAALLVPRTEASPAAHLLWGATGSGKTEVYLHAAHQVLEQGRQVLMMVPEINLTPQLLSRVQSRFGAHRVVAMHSGLTPAQRLMHWLMAHLGHAHVLLGTRMAVFASLPRLGLIVVDEEHDPSYKQQEGARYSARDVAVVRGRIEGVPVVLGSATPSLETWHNAMPATMGGAGRYQRLDMTGRVGDAQWPTVHTIDWRRLLDQHGRVALRAMGALSPPLLQALRDTHARGEQSLVLINRRGYAPVLHCAACGWKSACAHCSAWRVFHKGDRTLRCHHCGLVERVPRACPECGNVDIEPMGRGTERVEEQLAEHLPGLRMGRIDADTAKVKGALEAQLASVHAGDIDVLVGTQMIAKGHDFRRIGLVAALTPDAALFSSDFRGPERLFSLLMQAAGRAGRDAKRMSRSTMLIQTWYPDHPLYAALKAHDFAAFASSQLEERKGASLPPYTHLALLRAEGKTQAVAQDFLAAASLALADLPGASQVLLYPPVPTPVQKVADIERAQVLLESAQRGALQALLSAWTPHLLKLRAVHKGVIRYAVDVDPLII